MRAPEVGNGGEAAMAIVGRGDAQNRDAGRVEVEVDRPAHRVEARVELLVDQHRASEENDGRPVTMARITRPSA